MIETPTARSETPQDSISSSPGGMYRLNIDRCGDHALKSLPEFLMHNNIQHLSIIDCYSIVSFHPPIALKYLVICDCRKLEFLSPTELAALEHLTIERSCDSLESLSLGFFPKLRSLGIGDVANFSSLLISDDHMSLDTLRIKGCPKLVSFPGRGLPAPKLKSIILSDCQNLETLPHNLCRLTTLWMLRINNCPKLTSIPEGGFPDNLSSLFITSCDELTPHIEWGLHKLHDLTTFEIEGGCRDLSSFPEQNLFPSNLYSLRISRLADFKFLDYKGIQHLKSLKILDISCCDKLQSLPEEGLPSSLTYLYIKGCSLLKPKLQYMGGNDWYERARIPHVEIDDKVTLYPPT